MELTVDQMLQQGVAAHNTGNLQEAERLYRAILQSQPLHSDANHNLGLIAVSVNKADAALPLFKIALEANPKIEQFWLSYIDALVKANQLKGAKQAIKKAQKKGFDAKTLQALISQSKGTGDTKVPSQEQLSNLLEHYQNGRFGGAEKLAISITQEFPKHQFSWKVLGAVLGQSGRNSEAVNANQTAVALSPQDAEAHNNLGITLKELGRLDEAEASLRQAIVLKPDNAEVAHLVAALTGETPKAPPRIYVENLFDEYASKFDTTLVDNLEYKAPIIIAEMIMRNNNDVSLGSVLDLGCGTGLAGVEIKQFCAYLEGIDLSNKMLEKARRKNIYDKLTHRDIVDYLATESLDFDYFISMDVFIYLGDLSTVFQLIKSRNKSGGKLVFSTENTDKGGFFLEQSGRYSHSKQYIESLCEKFHYKLCHFEKLNLRKEKNLYISGGLYSLDF